MVAALQIVTQEEASDQFPVPPEEMFGELDYLPDSALTKVGEALVEAKFPRMVGEVVIDFRWKKKGGVSKGKPVLGKCVKLSGLAAHYSQGATYTIWTAADTVRSYRLTRYQLEAHLYHELCHIEPQEDEDGNVTWGINGHDIEAFRAEVEEYGLWMQDLMLFEGSIEKAREAMLPGFAVDDMEPQQRAGVQKAVNKFVKDTLGPNSGIDSMTFSVTGHDPVTITKEDADRI